MERTPGTLLPAVIRDLAGQSRCYSFEQLIRLLRLWAKPESGEAWERLARERMRFRPPLSLSFAPTDVHSLDLIPPDGPAEKTPDAPLRNVPFARAQVTASFLGLYGPSSPLPTFYTERLFDEAAEDLSVIRDFLDIFNNGFFLLYARLVSFSDPLRRTLEEEDPESARMLASFGGFAGPSSEERQAAALRRLRYAGLFSQFPRSALGLRTVIADAAGVASVRVIQHVTREVRVPEDQRMLLGLSSCVLGEDAVLGSRVPCHTGKIRIEMDKLDTQAMQKLMPGTAASRLLRDLISLYCARPLEYEIRLIADADAAYPLHLGGDAHGRFARLGCDAWLGGPVDEHSGRAAPLPSASAFFPAGYET